MPRRYRRSRRGYRPLKTVKYSNETTAIQAGFNDLVNGEEASAGTLINHVNQVVAPTNLQGMRKAKNFSLKLQQYTTTAALEAFAGSIWYALVYVPQGQSPSAINISSSSTVSLYEPNQNVIMSGIINGNQPVLTQRTRLARNLNSGDAIYLVLCYYSAGQGSTSYRYVSGQLNYAMTL